MKTIRYFIILSLLFLSSSTFAQQMAKVALQVNGLTCSMCSRSTETSLRSLDFIEDISPNLNTQVFILTFKKGQKVDLDQIKDKVQDAGFSVGNLAATINFNQATIDDKGFTVTEGTAFQFINAKNKTLNGPVTARVLDKDFVPSSTFKKNATTINSPAYQSGRGIVEGKDTRIFHLSL